MPLQSCPQAEILALRNEIVELVYIIVMLAEVEVALGCGAVSNHGLMKPRYWFEKIMTLPSQVG